MKKQNSLLLGGVGLLLLIGVVVIVVMVMRKKHTKPDDRTDLIRLLNQSLPDDASVSDAMAKELVKLRAMAPIIIKYMQVFYKDEDLAKMLLMAGQEGDNPSQDVKEFGRQLRYAYVKNGGSAALVDVDLKTVTSAMLNCYASVNPALIPSASVLDQLLACSQDNDCMKNNPPPLAVQLNVCRNLNA